MKKICLLLLLFFLCRANLESQIKPFAFVATQKQLLTNKDTVIFLWDSYGGVSYGADSIRIPSIVMNYNGWTFLNKSVSGTNSGNFKLRLDSIKATPTGNHKKIVVLGLSVNDVGASMSVDSVVKNYKALIDTCKAHKITVFLIEFPPNSTYGTSLFPKRDTEQTQILAYFNNPSHFIPIREILGMHSDSGIAGNLNLFIPYFTIDKLHPYYQGNKIYAGQIDSIMRRFYKCNNSDTATKPNISEPTFKNYTSLPTTIYKGSFPLLVSSYTNSYFAVYRHYFNWNINGGVTHSVLMGSQESLYPYVPDTCTVSPDTSTFNIGDTWNYWVSGDNERSSFMGIVHSALIGTPFVSSANVAFYMEYQKDLGYGMTNILGTLTALSRLGTSSINLVNAFDSLISSGNISYNGSIQNSADTISALTFPAKFTIIIKCRTYSTGVQQLVFSHGAGNQFFLDFLPTTTSYNTAQFVGGFNHTMSYGVNTYAGTDSTWAVNSKGQIFTNGVLRLDASNTLTAPGTFNIKMGQYYNSTLPWKGRIYRMAIIFDEISPTEINNWVQ